MRKNSPRKWLHACLDLLPVILIPVFMIYSHRHTIDSGSIDVPQNLVVDFNQILPSSIVSQSYLNNGFTSTFSSDDNSYTINGSFSQNTELQIIGANQSSLNILTIGHKYLVKLTGYGSNVEFASDYQGTGYTAGSYEFVASSSDASYFNVRAYISGQTYCNGYINLFDLTQMFGVGNEPSVQQFLSWYPNDYYEYTLSHKELLKNTSTLTYSDIDIMSQFTYQLYNSVDKYFNMGNVFNMTSVYDWFNLNIFGGNAPISIYIVWNIVLYEFVMDLLFLLYGLFMWFIDMVEHIMDKPFKSIK